MASPEHKGRLDEGIFTEDVETGSLGPRTARMHAFLSERVIGQSQAIDVIARRFQDHYAGLQDEVQPIAILLFTGPTGVGKTLLAKELSRFLVADMPIAPLTKVDCGKYFAKEEVAELVGSPAGYVRSEEPGLLAQVRIDAPHFWVKVNDILEGYRGPTDAKTLEMLMIQYYEQFAPYYSVILFDEIEKAHPKLHDIMLGMMEDGILPMNDGSVTLFRNSVIIMTSNIAGEDQQAAAEGRGSVGFRGTRHEDSLTLDEVIIEKTMDRIKKFFPREWIGRLEKNIVVFRMLQQDSCGLILDIELAKVQRLLDTDAEGGETIRVHYSETFREWILGMAEVSLYGARDIRSLVKDHVKGRLSAAKECEYLIEGDEVLFTMVDGQPALRRMPRLPKRHGGKIVSVEGDSGTSIVPVSTDD